MRATRSRQSGSLDSPASISSSPLSAMIAVLVKAPSGALGADVCGRRGNPVDSARVFVGCKGARYQTLGVRVDGSRRCGFGSGRL
jgi:hypothetical protein